MGLGKTVITVALIMLNPPPLHRRILPPEHLWSLEKKATIDHPGYIPPPNAGSSGKPCFARHPCHCSHDISQVCRFMKYHMVLECVDGSLTTLITNQFCSVNGSRKLSGSRPIFPLWLCTTKRTRWFRQLPQEMWLSYWHSFSARSFEKWRCCSVEVHQANPLA